jgi:hypothetical protein
LLYIEQMKEKQHVVIWLSRESKLCFTLKPFCCIWSAMWTSWPAAWSLFPLCDICTQAFDMFGSCLCFFHYSYPTNPFVSCQWSEVIPRIYQFGMCSECFPEIIRYFMDDTCSDLEVIHRE